MLKAILTLEQEQIIEDICEIQIKSLLRISSQNGCKKYADKIGIEIDNLKVNSDISEMLRVFDKLKSKPDSIVSLGSRHLASIKHILLNFDHRYSNKGHKDAKTNLWKKISISENFNLLPN
jgi:hypothetical protein